MEGVITTPASGERSGPKGPPADYAVVIDESMDAVYLRDLCLKAAQEHHTRAARANQRRAVRENMGKHECFVKYADRFEHIRKEEARRISARLGVTT